MSVKFYFQNTKQIMHFSHASFRSICSFPALFLQGLILWRSFNANELQLTTPPCRRGERARRSAAGLSEEGEEKRGSVLRVLFLYYYIEPLFICFKAQ